LRLKPEMGDAYGNLINGYLQLNRLDKAQDTGRQAQSRRIDSPEIQLHLYWVAFLQQDSVEMERQAAELMGKPGYEDQILNSESDTALYQGS
jgi:hypothetical protein